MTLQEILHWLVDRGSRPQPADAPTAEDVHAAVDALTAAPEAPAEAPAEEAAPADQPDD